MKTRTRAAPHLPILVFSGILTEAARPAQASAESVRNDVDQDVFMMFNVVDENLSWYLQDNILRCRDPTEVDPEDPDFMESNKMHGEKPEGFDFVLNEPSNVTILGFPSCSCITDPAACVCSLPDSY